MPVATDDAPPNFPLLLAFVAAECTMCRSWACCDMCNMNLIPFTWCEADVACAYVGTVSLGNSAWRSGHALYTPTMNMQTRVQALRTLALGQHAPDDPTRPRAETDAYGLPWPDHMPRLKQLSSLTLHNVGWNEAKYGLPAVPQVRCKKLLCQTCN